MITDILGTDLDHPIVHEEFSKRLAISKPRNVAPFANGDLIVE